MHSGLRCRACSVAVSIARIALRSSSLQFEHLQRRRRPQAVQELAPVPENVPAPQPEQTYPVAEQAFSFSVVFSIVRGAGGSTALFFSRSFLSCRARFRRAWTAIFGSGMRRRLSFNVSALRASTRIAVAQGSMKSLAVVASSTLPAFVSPVAGILSSGLHVETPSCVVSGVGDSRSSVASIVGFFLSGVAARLLDTLHW